jgi:predicted transcriptional regulator
MSEERLVRDIYHKGIILCSPGAPLQEVVRVMADTEVHAVMVAEKEGDSPQGVVTHIDVIAHFGEDLTAIHTRDVMTTSIIAVAEDAAVREAASKLIESNIHRLLVVGTDGEPLGILSTTDIVREMRGSRWVWSLQ